MSGYRTWWQSISVDITCHIFSWACYIAWLYNILMYLSLFEIHNSPGDEGWYCLTIVLNFGFFNGPKKNSNSTQFILGLQSRQNLNNPLVRVRRQSSSLSPSSSPSPAIWQSLPKKGAKSMAKLLGPRSGTACAGRTGEHKLRAFPSRLQLLLAANYHSCDTDLVQELKRF